MDRNVRALTIALLCVLAVSLAAATLANPQQPSGAGTGSGGIDQGDSGTDELDGTSHGNGMDNPEVDERGGSSLRLTACIPILMSPMFILGVVLVIAAVSYAGYRRDGLVPAIAILFVMSTLLLPGYLMFTDCGMSSDSRPGTDIIPPIESGPSEGGEAGGGEAGSESVFSPPFVLAGLLAVALLFGAVVFRASGGEEPTEDPPVEEPTEAGDEETLTAIGDVAGEAADRIEESVDIENEVYRAWHEMTTHLDIGNPAASTPTEFAAAARDAGMSETHVATLTGLFQEVRYGGEEATPDREDRAVDALRAIERTYGGEQ